MADPSPGISVSIVLVTYNAWEYTRRCLATLLSDSFPPGLEIILVDNHSRDMTAELATREFPDVNVIEAGENLGFGLACNLGMAQAQGEFAALLNNDALLYPDQLLQLLEAYRRLQLRGIYSARLIDESGHEEPSCFRFIGPNELLSHAFRRLGRATDEAAYALAGLRDEALEVEWCSGAFMFFRRETWAECGGFDDNFFMYYEDVDLCARWRERGYGCHVNTCLSVVHSCGGSSSDPVERARLVDRSQRYYYAKHYGRSGAVKCRLFQIMRSGIRSVAHALLGFSAHQRRECHLHLCLLGAALVEK